MSPDCPLVGTHWHPFRLIDYIHTAKTDMVANVESVEFSVTIRVRPVSRGILKRARKK